MIDLISYLNLEGWAHQYSPVMTGLV